ncbi:MAG: prephenate dehydrogenase/arogenate dehydrogenase family protein [Deltaproteobacteria bacterium]|nr:MAG: prephenate dehydrogenase/arogenate dehydrogenase family protein [Deltaproteobacteria bacterium]RLB10114.1 MAG: prephenate dehydrogenase/arogenate dehydrogenase family protein [Deltaproteobacteria bacterium]HEC32339.1 prephenate dehydrogenase/arogenate dehydrogenase family protein [Deltaproteobacteria bacterium]
MTDILWSTIGIVGGKGEMGRFFAHFFQNKGFRVEVSDLDTPLSNRELVELSDIVLFSVPLHLAEKIIEETVPYTRQNQLLMDVSSLKEKPVKAMLKSEASVIGLHPMFGPQVSSIKGQTIIACPIRIDKEKKQSVYRLFESSGARIKETTPEEHDKMMSIIQVLIHFSTIIMGRTLREMGVSIEESLDYTSPIYRLEMNFIGRLFAQDPALYGAIGMLNPHSEEVLRKLHESFVNYLDIIRTKNLEAFINDFKKTANFFGPYSPQAMEESGAILDFVINGKREKDTKPK